MKEGASNPAKHESPVLASIWTPFEQELRRLSLSSLSEDASSNSSGFEDTGEAVVFRGIGTALVEKFELPSSQHATIEKQSKTFADGTVVKNLAFTSTLNSAAPPFTRRLSAPTAAAVVSGQQSCADEVGFSQPSSSQTANRVAVSDAAPAPTEVGVHPLIISPHALPPNLLLVQHVDETGLCHPFLFRLVIVGDSVSQPQQPDGTNKSTTSTSPFQSQFLPPDTTLGCLLSATSSLPPASGTSPILSTLHVPDALEPVANPASMSIPMFVSGHGLESLGTGQNHDSHFHCSVEFKRGRRAQYECTFIVNPGEFVIVSGDRGQDLGKIVRHWTASNTNALDSETFPYENISKPVVCGGEQIAGRVARRASTDEVAVLSGEQAKLEKSAVEMCQKKVMEHGLSMLVVDAEFQFDRKKLTYYYDANDRQDFRDLVRDLYRTYHARIWMCKVGSQGKATIAP